MSCVKRPVARFTELFLGIWINHTWKRKPACSRWRLTKNGHFEDAFTCSRCGCPGTFSCYLSVATVIFRDVYFFSGLLMFFSQVETMKFSASYGQPQLLQLDTSPGHSATVRGTLEKSPLCKCPSASISRATACAWCITWLIIWVWQCVWTQASTKTILILDLSLSIHTRCVSICLAADLPIYPRT